MLTAFTTAAMGAIDLFDHYAGRKRLHWYTDSADLCGSHSLSSVPPCLNVDANGARVNISRATSRPTSSQFQTVTDDIHG